MSALTIPRPTNAGARCAAPRSPRPVLTVPWMPALRNMYHVLATPFFMPPLPKSTVISRAASAACSGLAPLAMRCWYCARRVAVSAALKNAGYQPSTVCAMDRSLGSRRNTRCSSAAKSVRLLTRSFGSHATMSPPALTNSAYRPVGARPNHSSRMTRMNDGVHRINVPTVSM